MKPNVILTIVLVIFSFLFIQSAGAMDVGGDISENTTWSLAESPVNLIQDVTVKGVELNIENNVVVNLNGYDIYFLYDYLGAGNYAPTSPEIYANYVEFNGGQNLLSQFYFQGHKSNNTEYPAIGKFENCDFQNVEIVFNQYSSPEFLNSTLSSELSGTAFKSCYGSQPELTGNVITGYNFAFHIFFKWFACSSV